MAGKRFAARSVEKHLAFARHDRRADIAGPREHGLALLTGARAGLRPVQPSFSRPETPRRMSWWSRLLGDKSDGDLKPKRLDYLSEALTLERQGDYDAALTSYRLPPRGNSGGPGYPPPTACAS